MKSKTTNYIKKAGRGNFKLREVKLPYNKKSDEVLKVITEIDLLNKESEE